MFLKRINQVLTNLSKEFLRFIIEFNSNKALEDFRYKELSEKINSIPKMVECSNCHCMVDYDMAILGESKIIRDLLFNETIKKTYYCHKCGGDNETKETGNLKRRSTKVSK